MALTKLNSMIASTISMGTKMARLKRGRGAIAAVYSEKSKLAEEAKC